MAARWRLAYGARLVEEEVASLEQVRELERIELLFDRLGDVAGGILSMNSLREDLEVAFETVRNWIAIFERLDAVFRLPPYGGPRIKAVKKEQKLYFWDWARCASESARFENMLALHLLRAVHWAADIEGEKLQLRYFRHRAGQEVDFVVLRGRRPWLAIKHALGLGARPGPALLRRADAPGLRIPGRAQRGARARAVRHRPHARPGRLSRPLPRQPPVSNQHATSGNVQLEKFTVMLTPQKGGIPSIVTW